MTEEFMEALGAWLTQTVDNIDTPATYPNHDDFKREWFHLVAEVATKLAKEVSYE